MSRVTAFDGVTDKRVYPRIVMMRGYCLTLDITRPSSLFFSSPICETR
jgi:hypothetical protein